MASMSFPHVEAPVELLERMLIIRATWTPPFAQREFEKFLAHRQLSHGFARVQCDR
jgi:hypothetical protein